MRSMVTKAGFVGMVLAATTTLSLAQSGLSGRSSTTSGIGTSPGTSPAPGAGAPLAQPSPGIGSATITPGQARTDRIGSPVVPSTRDIGTSQEQLEGGRRASGSGGSCNPANHTAQSDFGPTPTIAGEGAARPPANAARDSEAAKYAAPSTGIGVRISADAKGNRC